MIQFALFAAALAVAPTALADAPWAMKLPPKIPESLAASLVPYRYFVDCVATSEWDVAQKLFDTGIGSSEESAILGRIGGRDYGTTCSYALRMSMTSLMMRGGIGEARYRIKTRNSAPVVPSVAEVAPVPAGASFQWVDYGKSSAPSRLFRFTRCLAEREGASVAAVFQTRLGSKAEREAMQALSRRLGSCLLAGETLKAYPLTLRAWLGEAQYQHYRKTAPDA